ncbi:MAG: LysR family transcriptional regulator [Rhodospirillales bacterium]|jgi:LysR family transcriptional regulator for bpeEF and oprC|uniref:LysR family transcriptional regulator n=1 Tax=Albidovulum sp. TaxID=1872424 RepID=UPI001E0E1B8B|nr:LysR family transcriptional regulator [Paracoccaceae bacterium]MCC7017063.1 LysR family transcriptional regulator [Rhodospirillales bacterium]
MDHLRAMRLFLRVAELGSLTAASTDLGLARGAASTIVADLERHLGVQLLERTTRRLRLTEDGARYLDRARQIVTDVDELENDIGAAERSPRGLLRVQLPPGIARIIVVPALPDFVARHPGIELEILSRTEVPDFVGQRLDAALLVGPLPELDIVARSVGQLPQMTVAAPAYLGRAGHPARPDDLDRHACLPILSSRTGRAQPWRFHIEGRDVTMPVRGPLAFEAAEAAVAAARCGAGILQLASYLIFDDVRAGRLVPVLDAFRPAPQPAHIVHPRHRLKPRRLKVFEEFLIELNQTVRRRWNIREIAAPVTPSAPPST